MSIAIRTTLLRSTVVAAATALCAAISTLPAQALDAQWCKDVHIRFFVGGAEGDAFGTIVYNGAKQAAADLGPKVDYIFSQWDVEKMVQQLREAVAVKPNGIAIEGWHDPVYRNELEITGQVRALDYLKQCRGGASYLPNPV